MIIAGKIDCTKIDKSRLFEGKNGAKYLDVIIRTTDEADQYGNHGMITQSVSKDEREQGVKGTILGNIKILKQDSRRPAVTRPAAEPVDAGNKDDCEIPF